MLDLEHEKEYTKKIQAKADKNNRVYVFNEVALEITRRCPLNCDHCLKGEQQLKGMSREVMEEFFENVMGIRTLSLASGETTFAIKKLKILNEVLREYKPTVEKIFIYSNGIKVTDEYIEQLKLLREYVVNSGPHPDKNNYDMSHGVLRNVRNTGKTPLVIAISNDKFHKKAREEYFKRQAIESKNPQNRDKFVEGLEKLVDNFPVAFLDDNILLNTGKARNLEGVKKINKPIKKIGIWPVSRYGVEIVHTIPFMGVCYNGAFGDVQMTYEEQDRKAVKVDASKTKFERLLEVENAKLIKGGRKKFLSWISLQDLKFELFLLNPFNYTKKADADKTNCESMVK